MTATPVCCSCGIIPIAEASFDELKRDNARLAAELAESRDALKAIWPYINNHDGRYWADREYQAAIDKVKAQVNK
jgi:hypothetical protein